MIKHEDGQTEFKSQYTPEVIKTVIAFANTNGGTLYFGIEDDGTICGITDVDETMLKISNAIRDSIKPDVTLFVDYQQEQKGDKTILIVHIQKGTSSPYYLKKKGIRPEGVYIRQGASSVPATETAILNMIKTTDGDSYEEARSLNQNLTFTVAEEEFQKRNIPFATEQKKTLGIINADGMYTNLGLLLSDQCVHTIKLAVYEEKAKLQFKDRKEFSGSLLAQLQDAYDFIDRYNDTRSEINGLHREDFRSYPVEAIREALLNALVHRDYSFSDSTLISIFDNRIEFTSIGGLVRGITFQDIMLGISVARNRKLADIFYRLSLIESYGTGIPRLFHSYEKFPVTPEIKATDNAFKITIPNTLTQMTIADTGTLTLREEEVLGYLTTNESLTRKKLETMLGISQATATRVLKTLQNDGYIKASGAGKNTEYTLSKNKK